MENQSISKTKLIIYSSLGVILMIFIIFFPKKKDELNNDLNNDNDELNDLNSKINDLRDKLKNQKNDFKEKEINYEKQLLELKKEKSKEPTPAPKKDDE